MPPAWMVRLPQVVPWSGVSAVSPSTTLHRAERHVELLGAHLRERGAHAGAEIDLAGIERDPAARVDGKEGVDLGDRQRPLRRRLLRPAPSSAPESEKLTTSAPPPLSRSRRDGVKCLVMIASLTL